MMSKFLPLNSLVCLLIATVSAVGQTENGEPFEEDRNAAYVRFWNLLPPGSVPITVAVQNPGGGFDPVMTASLPGTMSGSNYWHVAPGRFGLRIIDQATSEELETASFRTKVGEWFTVIAHQPSPDSPPTLEVIEDPTETSTPDVGNVMIFNTLTGASAKATAVPAKNAGTAISPLSRVTLDLPTGTEAVELEITVQGKPPFTTIHPVELEIGSSLALLIIEDRYGRVRPRMVYRGFTKSAFEPSPESEAASARPAE